LTAHKYQSDLYVKETKITDTSAQQMDSPAAVRLLEIED